MSAWTGLYNQTVSITRLTDAKTDSHKDPTSATLYTSLSCMLIPASGNEENRYGTTDSSAMYTIFVDEDDLTEGIIIAKDDAVIDSITYEIKNVEVIREFDNLENVVRLDVERTSK